VARTLRDRLAGGGQAGIALTAGRTTSHGWPPLQTYQRFVETEFNRTAFRLTAFAGAGRRRPRGQLRRVGRCDADRDLQRNGRLANLLGWLEEAAPDIVCLQELKAPDDKFPAAAFRAAGYGAVWHGQESWNRRPYTVLHDQEAVLIPAADGRHRSRYVVSRQPQRCR